MSLSVEPPESNGWENWPHAIFFRERRYFRRANATTILNLFLASTGHFSSVLRDRLSTILLNEKNHRSPSLPLSFSKKKKKTTLIINFWKCNGTTDWPEIILIEPLQVHYYKYTVKRGTVGPPFGPKHPSCTDLGYKGFRFNLPRWQAITCGWLCESFPSLSCTSELRGTPR